MRLRPNFYLQTFLHGLVAYNEKNYSAAVQDFNQAIREQPDWASTYLYRGLAYSSDGQPRRAIPDYQKLIQLHPYLAAAYNDLGWAYQESGEPVKAKLNFDRAIEIEPDFTRARRNLAMLFASQNNREGELSQLDILQHLRPDDQWARDARANPSQLLGALTNGSEQVRPDVMPMLISKVEPQYNEEARLAAVNAMVLCDLVVAPNGKPENIRVARAAGFGLDENAVQAVSAWRFRPALAHGTPVAAKAQIEVTFRLQRPGHENQMARLDFSVKPGEERPQMLRGTVPENPRERGDARLRIALEVGMDGKIATSSVTETTSSEWADKTLREMKGWRFRPATLNGQAVDSKGVFEVVHAVSGVIRFSPTPHAPSDLGAPTASGPDPNWQPKSVDEYLARGYAEMKLRRAPQALEDADEVLRTRPDLAAALLLQGRAEYALKNYPAAIAGFNKVIQQNSDWADLYRDRGLAYFDSGQRQPAINDLQKAVDLDPNSAASHNALGAAYSDMAQWDLAKAQFDLAIELEPNSVRARENRGKLAAKRGDVAAERSEITFLLALFPDNRWAIDAKQELLRKVR